MKKSPFKLIIGQKGNNPELEDHIEAFRLPGFGAEKPGDQEIKIVIDQPKEKKKSVAEALMEKFDPQPEEGECVEGINTQTGAPCGENSSPAKFLGIGRRGIKRKKLMNESGNIFGMGDDSPLKRRVSKRANASYRRQQK